MDDDVTEARVRTYASVLGPADRLTGQLRREFVRRYVLSSELPPLPLDVALTDAERETVLGVIRGAALRAVDERGPDWLLSRSMMNPGAAPMSFVDAQHRQGHNHLPHGFYIRDCVFGSMCAPVHPRSDDVDRRCCAADGAPGQACVTSMARDMLASAAEELRRGGADALVIARVLDGMCDAAPAAEA